MPLDVGDAEILSAFSELSLRSTSYRLLILGMVSKEETCSSVRRWMSQKTSQYRGWEGPLEII